MRRAIFRFPCYCVFTLCSFCCLCYTSYFFCFCHVVSSFFNFAVAIISQFFLSTKRAQSFFTMVSFVLKSPLYQKWVSVDYSNLMVMDRTWYFRSFSVFDLRGILPLSLFKYIVSEYRQNNAA